MVNRLGLERRDGRNLLVVAVIMGTVIAATTEGTLAVRLAVGSIAALLAAGSFLVATVVINRFKPEHW